MKRGKKILVVIMIILILLLLAGGAFAYVYMATDILKTDKELFFKYFAQITSEDGFIDQRITDFTEKKKQNAYENSGNISVNAQLAEDLGISTEKLNDLSISFKGKVDPLNEKVEQNIEIDYGNDVIFPVNYRQDGNKIGLQIEKLSKKFIAVRNENLKEFATNLGVEDVSEIPNQIKISEKKQELEFSTEEIEQLKQIYGKVLEEQLLDENFSSIKTEQSESYTLTLSNGQQKNLIVKLLEKTKQNTLIIDKINEIIEQNNLDIEKITTEDIDEQIKSINEEDISNISDLKLTLIQSNKQLSQITIQSGDSKITIQKNTTSDELSYEINCEIKAENKEIGGIFEEGKSNTSQLDFYFNAQYTGLQDLTDVQSNYKIGFGIGAEDKSMEYDYKVNTNTQFKGSVSIEEFNEDGTMFLNDHDKEQVINFLSQVGTKLVEINKTQMEQLGLKEYENPLLYSNPITTLGIMVYSTASDVVDDASLSTQEINSFNAMFTPYIGEEIKGSEVNVMIETVLSNNLQYEMESGKIVKVTLDESVLIEGNEDTVSNTLDSSKLYVVEAVYNDDGYVSEMKITTKN